MRSRPAATPPGTEDRQIAPTERRGFLKLLGTASVAGQAILLAACAGGVPPRQYKRPPSARYYGGKGGPNR